MRVSIVPAQITTVEDKIAGNISVQQAGLLGIPVLLGFAVIVFLPPNGQFVLYKILIVAVLFLICGSLATRIKGRILAQWAVLLVRYCMRPQYYVYDKNTTYLRASEEYKTLEPETQDEAKVVQKVAQKPFAMAQHEFIRLEQFARDRRAKLKFEVGKKGELNVSVTEIK